MTPAGPAVCPHTAKRPENNAGRAAWGAKNTPRSYACRQKPPKSAQIIYNEAFFSSLLGADLNDRLHRCNTGLVITDSHN